MTTTVDEIRDNFALLDEWDDRYRYVIELGRMLEPLRRKSTRPKTRCRLRQPSLAVEASRGDANGEPRLTYLGDSDAISSAVWSRSC